MKKRWIHFIKDTGGGAALCGKYISHSVICREWSEVTQDTEKITCPRCLERLKKGELNEYLRYKKISLS